MPLHITGFFAPFFLKDPLFCGSIGAGLVLEPKIECFLKPREKTEVFFNREKVKIESVNRVLEIFRNSKAEIKILSPVPLGVGYGTSGAVSLAVSLALCKLFKKSKKEGGKIAHIAEVRSLTGLGDVSAIFYGRALAVRIKPGAPGIGRVISFPQPKNIQIITGDLKKGDTRKMLKKITPEIISLGKNLTEDFLKKPTLENFFEYSQIFSKKIGWAKERLFKKLEKIKKYCLGFSMKKGVFFLAVERNSFKKVFSFLKQEISKDIHVFRLFNP